MRFIVKHRSSNEYLQSTAEGLPFLDVTTFTPRKEDAKTFVCPVIAQREIVRLQKHDESLDLSIDELVAD